MKTVSASRRRSATALAVLAALAAGCSRQPERNYKHCLRLLVGMTREELMGVMGPPETTLPYVEGESLPYLKGRTAYEWSNPGSMPGPDHVSIDDATGLVQSIRCANAEITAGVFLPPPAPRDDAASAVPAPALSTAPARAPALSTAPAPSTPR